jgi:hypothetical protein
MFFLFCQVFVVYAGAVLKRRSRELVDPATGKDDRETAFAKDKCG